MPSNPIHRTGRQRRSVNQALKNLAARKYGFPVQTGTRPGTQARGIQIAPMPPGWQGTLPEWAIFDAHQQLDLIYGVEWVYQWQVGHPNDPDSARLDFYELDRDIGINVNGTFFHYLMGGDKIESDLAQGVRLQALGYRMIYIDETDALRDPVYYLREAREFKDYSLLARGFA